MEIDLDLEMDKDKAAFLLLGAAIGIIVTLGYINFSEAGSASSAKLVSFLENQSGQDLELVRTQPAGKYYEADIRTSEDQLMTYYTNGKKFTTEIQDIQELRDRSTALTQFSQCLQSSEVVMFGNLSQRSTQLQIQVLGGTSVVSPIYQDVSNDRVIQQAARLGIQQVPALYQNQSAIQGVKTLEQLEQFTGCNYQLN